MRNRNLREVGRKSREQPRPEETGEFDIGAGVVLLGARTAVLLRYFNKKKKGAYAK